MRILVLGGTKFLGRSIVDAALAAGHELTLFTRGETNPDLFPEAEHLRGDRERDLGALEAGDWDAVVDTSGYVPRVVRRSAELLRDRVGTYCFISSISVYADLSAPTSEDSALGELDDPSVETIDAETYGPLKVACERAVEEVYGDRALIVRPGLIVGPHDPTDRFTYWPRRLARGGEILGPAPPDGRVQFIDVRDLSAWIVRLLERRVTGVFNATSEGVEWRELLAGGDITWVDGAFLAEQGVGEWMELPLWVHSEEVAGLHQADVSRAVAAGLTFRPVAETVRDTAAWDATRGEYEPKAGLAPERERDLLEAWRARRESPEQEPTATA